MPASTLQIIGVLSLAMATSAAIPMRGTNDRPPAASQSAISAAAQAVAGPALPADFPLPPGLSPCKPLVASGEIICDWHRVPDALAIYKFYLKALPKAGYTVIPGLRELPPDYHGPLGLGFRKGAARGAVTIASGDLSIQYIANYVAPK
jgi:hypothetical protein